MASVVDRTFDAERRSLKDDGKAGRWRSPLDLHVLPHIGRKRVDDLTTDDLRDCLGKIWTSKPETARKASNRLTKVMRHARLEGADCDERMVADAKALLGPQNFKTAHISATPVSDIPDLYAAICGLEQTPATLCLRLTLLTVQRGKPVRTALLDQFDLANGVWTVPGDALKGRAGKTKDFLCPLSAEAVRAVDISYRYSSGGKLFPAQRGAGFVSDVAVSKIMDKLGQAGRVHGLRSSFRDWCEHDGVDYALAEMSLQHVVGNAVERAYRRDDRLDARRDVLDRWATYACSERDKQRRADLQVVT